MIKDAKDYTSALDFNTNDHFLISTPEGSSPAGATPQESPSATSVPAPVAGMAPALVSAPAAPKATAAGTDWYVMHPGVTRAVTRCQVHSSAATNYRANRNYRAAAVVGFFQKDTVPQVHKLGSPKLGFHANSDIAHQLDDTCSAGNAYATTNTQRRFSTEEKRRKSPTPSRRLWAFHKRGVGQRHLTRRSQAWKSMASSG